MDHDEGRSSQVELSSLVGTGSHNSDHSQLYIGSFPSLGLQCANLRQNNSNAIMIPVWPHFLPSRRILLYPLFVLAFLFMMKVLLQDMLEKESLSNPNRKIAPTVALFGNSMLYYNDCPRLLEILLLNNDVSPFSIYQNSCLRGGANFKSLWDDGNGMQSRFSLRSGTNDTIGAPTVQWLLSHPPSSGSHWDFVVLQDDELYVTNQNMRNISLEALRRNYLPQLRLRDAATENKTVVLLLETFAYKSARLRERIHLGGMEDFSHAVSEGIKVYQGLVLNEADRPCYVVPMATAVQYISITYPELFNKLYNSDGVHPTPHCTWLQACLLVAMVTSRAPVPWDDNIQQQWQARARHWSSSPSGKALLVPSDTEAQLLRQVACEIAGLGAQACSR